MGWGGSWPVLLLVLGIGGDCERYWPLLYPSSAVTCHVSSIFCTTHVAQNMEVTCVSGWLYILPLIILVMVSHVIRFILR